MIYLLIAVFFIGCHWFLYYGYFFYTKNQKKSIIYDYIPRLLYGLDVRHQYHLFINYVRFFLYVLMGSILVITHPKLIESWFSYINWFIDVFMVVPAILTSASLLGLIVIIFYIILGCSSEYRYNINADSKLVVYCEMLESCFWWAILYRILDLKYGDNNMIVALSVSLLYTVSRLSQYLHIITTVFPFYMVGYWFISMFFSCLLLTLADHILIPIIFSGLLLYFILNNWSVVVPKIKFSRDKVK